jgi:hypothetical protein
MQAGRENGYRDKISFGLLDYMLMIILKITFICDGDLSCNRGKFCSVCAITGGTMTQ